jgi:ethanolamine utilization protein EutQ
LYGLGKVKGSKSTGLVARNEEAVMSGKTPAALVRFEDLEFIPRFEHGEMAQLAEICGAGHGTPLGAGIVRMSGAKFDWTVTYDEVLVVLSGELKVTTKDGGMTAGPRDSVWLPAGTEITYEVQECMVVYAIHPASGNPTDLSAGEE